MCNEAIATPKKSNESRTWRGRYGLRRKRRRLVPANTESRFPTIKCIEFARVRSTDSGVAAILCVTAGCAGSQAGPPAAPAVPTAIERLCGPPHSRLRQAPVAHLPRLRPAHAGAARGGFSLAAFSPQAVAIADTIGARELLVSLPVLEEAAARGVEGALVRLLWARQQLSDRVLLGFLDVAQTAAEADCEEERADQLADRLQEEREKRTRYMTVVAIVGDGLVGILSGGLSLAGQDTAAAAGGISGGVLATGFGLGAIWGTVEYEFRRERNLLREIWEGPGQSSLMPASLWRYLSRPLGEDPTGRSLRESLIARWRQDGRLGDPGSETERRRIALFFGEGGAYTIEELRARAAMLDLLEADVNLMSQDLDLLLSEVLARDVPQPPAVP